MAIEGDGYEENKSPHSPHERFEGVTVGRMALVRIIYTEDILYRDIIYVSFIFLIICQYYAKI